MRDKATGKRYPLNMRTTFEVRRQLEAAAKASGRSLAQEAEYRIERSIMDERRMVEALELSYGRELSGIMLAIGEAMKLSGQTAAFTATRSLEGSQNWWDNAYAFFQASKAAGAVVEALKPEGDASPPRDLNEIFANLGHGVANTIIEEAGSGYTRTSGTVQRARLLHRALGPLAARLRKFCSEEWLNASSHIGDDEP
jgi:hypothetical protein